MADKENYLVAIAEIPRSTSFNGVSFKTAGGGGVTAVTGAGRPNQCCWATRCQFGDSASALPVADAVFADRVASSLGELTLTATGSNVSACHSE